MVGALPAGPAPGEPSAVAPHPGAGRRFGATSEPGWCPAALSGKALCHVAVNHSPASRLAKRSGAGLPRLPADQPRRAVSQLPLRRSGQNRGLSLPLHRNGLSPSTPYRSPGALPRLPRLHRFDWPTKRSDHAGRCAVIRRTCLPADRDRGCAVGSSRSNSARSGRPRRS